jgi:hypothetical protein
MEIKALNSEALERSLASANGRAASNAPVVEAFDPLPPATERAVLRPPAKSDAAAGRPDRDRSDRGEWWPTLGRPKRPLVPNAGWRNATLQARAEKVIGVSVCGLGRSELEQAVALVAAQQAAQRDFIPVFLTDSTDFDVFREHGYVFEYLPAHGERAACADVKAWDDYAAERRALIEKKWGLDRIISFGPREFGRPAEPQAEDPAAPVSPLALSSGGEAAPAEAGERSTAPSGRSAE